MQKRPAWGVMPEEIKDLVKAILEKNGCKILNPDRPKVPAPNWTGYEVMVGDGKVDVVLISVADEYEVIVGSKNMSDIKRHFNTKNAIDTLEEVLSRKSLLGCVVGAGFGKTSGRKIYGV